MKAQLEIIFLLTTLPFLLLVFSKVTFGLEGNQLKAVQEAIKCLYKITYLRNFDANQDIILAGETHVVNKERHEIAKLLIKEFPLIGLEGVRMNALAKPITSLGRSKDRTLALKVGTFPGPIKLAGEKIGGNQYEGLREILAWYKYQDESLKKALRRGFPITEEPGLLLIPGISRETIIDETTIDAIIKEAESFLSKTGVVELEFYEPIPQSLQDLARLQEGAPEELIERSMDDRNFIMAQSILRTLEKHPKDKTLLVLVGEDHVDGISAILADKGFTNSALPL